MSDIEIKEVREEISRHTKKIRLISFMKSDDFKQYLSTYPINICENCGLEYRIGHWCDSTKEHEWNGDWEALVKISLSDYNAKKKEEKKLVNLQGRQTSYQSQSTIDEFPQKRISPAAMVSGFFLAIVVLILVIVINAKA